MRNAAIWRYCNGMSAKQKAHDDAAPLNATENYLHLYVFTREGRFV